jgi:hypothetical protein
MITEGIARLGNILKFVEGGGGVVRIVAPPQLAADIWQYMMRSVVPSADITSVLFAIVFVCFSHYM